MERKGRRTGGRVKTSSTHSTMTARKRKTGGETGEEMWGETGGMGGESVGMVSRRGS